MKPEPTTKRMLVPGLSHKWLGKEESFFQSIDDHGGWPVGYQYIGFEHTDERGAGFCNSPHNDGWWTVVASADDYYLWKLSPEALQRIVNAAVSAIVLPRPVASQISIRNSTGHKATIRGAK